MRNTLEFFAILATVGALAVTDVAAQDRSSRRGPQDRAEMEQRVRAQMQRITKERLQLTEEESVELSEVIQGFDEQRRTLRRNDMAARRRIEALMLEGGTDEEEAAELLSRVGELRRQEVQLFEAEQSALLEILPAAKVLELQSLREEMGRRMRSLRGGDGPGGRRRPGGGPGEGNVDWVLGIDLST
jgi:Spy/CpxP family protein refolding chaperone